MVLAKVLLCKFPEVLVEGSGEHQVAVIIILVDIFFELATLKRIKVGSRERHSKHLPPPDMIFLNSSSQSDSSISSASSMTVYLKPH